MDFQQRDESISLLSEVSLAVRDLGVRGAINALRSARGNDSPVLDERAEYLLTAICQHYCVTAEDIFGKGCKTQKKKMAFGFAVFYLNETLGFSLRETGLIMKKDKSSCSRASNGIKRSLREKDNNILQAKRKFDAMLKEKKIK